jgi:hypothetical protein
LLPTEVRRERWIAARREQRRIPTLVIAKSAATGQSILFVVKEILLEVDAMFDFFIELIYDSASIVVRNGSTLASSSRKLGSSE